MVAIFSLFTVAILSLLVTRIAAMALMFTGLSREVAHFQARSAFLGIERKGGFYIGAPQGVSKIHEGDVLLMYGPIERLKELDLRQAGSAGDQAHYDAIVGHQSELKAQAELDELQKAQEKGQTEEV